FCRHLTMSIFFVFFFTAAAPPAIYTLSLHDALPILHPRSRHAARCGALGRPARERLPVRHRRSPGGGGTGGGRAAQRHSGGGAQDRKSTRLNSSHLGISYAVFCLKKKKKNNIRYPMY